ncbi:MAG: carboxymuconolactone decarboxylase family protein [Acidobacteriaceae bacterium]|nr:carboxymuconolactone decarboxylase family protein [Acidobacteriaceae bacterium]
MARIPYARPEQYEELMRNIRLPEDAARTNAFGMLAHAPAIGGSVLKLIHSILTAADLDFFLHELVILRVSQRCQAWYAWTQHITVAQAIGLSDAQTAALARGEAPEDLFSPRERALLAFTDEVLDRSRVSDRTFERVQQEFSTREVVELLITIGYFRMIGSLLTNLEVELDPRRAEELLELAYNVA